MGYGTEVTVKAAVGRPIVKFSCGKTYAYCILTEFDGYKIF